MKYVYKCNTCKIRFGSDTNTVTECEKCHSEDIGVVECNLYECDTAKIISTLSNEKLRRKLDDPVGTLNQWKDSNGRIVSIHMLSESQIDDIIKAVTERKNPQNKVDVMPFGKHKGKPLTELPDNYMAWLLTQNMLKEPLNTKIRKIVWNKIKDNCVDEIINKWAMVTCVSKVK